ncbi:class C beta-lactamase [Paracoccus nototheniae]|uniref:Beta-lactamase n=1 Tax=Paracoccus nototheniae TaxID=2489002 RepID=A0ABW4DYZ5_9RHOB|nr:class C beta-lactamase [Paracoccus nototheniae]
MTLFRPLGLAIGLIAAPAHAFALTDAAFQDMAEQAFRPVIEEFDIPGIAIGVTLDGQQFFFADGLADRQAQRPVDTDTLFELGSVSKLFTVALAGLADGQGRLSLDAPVSQERPDLAGGAFDRITLNDLAAHATGDLPLQVPDSVTSGADLNRYLADWTPATDPATTRSYSNVSIGLLGQIAAASFDTGYEDAIGRHLLPDLGLDSTFVTVPDHATDRYALGYRVDDDSPVRVNPGLLDAEAYGIKSSVADMTRFLEAHLGDPDLPDEMTKALAKTRVARHDSAHFAQGLVWEAYPWPVDPARLAAGNAPPMALEPQPVTPHDPVALAGPVLLNKTGATTGFGAYVAMVPSERIGVVVLANRNYPNPVRAEATRQLIEAIVTGAGH